MMTSQNDPMIYTSKIRKLNKIKDEEKKQNDGKKQTHWADQLILCRLCRLCQTDDAHIYTQFPNETCYFITIAQNNHFANGFVALPCDKHERETRISNLPKRIAKSTGKFIFDVDFWRRNNTVIELTVIHAINWKQTCIQSITRGVYDMLWTTLNKKINGARLAMQIGDVRQI